MKNAAENILVSNMKDEESYILAHLDEVAKVNDEVKDEVKRAVENLREILNILMG